MFRGCIEAQIAGGHLVVSFPFTTPPGAAVVDVDLHLHADLFEEAGCDLGEAQVDDVAVVVGGPEAHAVRAAWVAGLVEQLLRLLRVVAVLVLELLWPLVEWKEIGAGRVAEHALGLPQRVPAIVALVNRLAVDRHLHCLADADVVERRPTGVQADLPERPEEVGAHLDVGVGAQHRLYHLEGLDVDAAAGNVDHVDLAGAKRGEAGRLLRHEQTLQLVDVGQPVLRILLVEVVVVGIARPGHRDALDVVSERERPGADHVSPVAVVTVLLDDLGWQNP